MRHCPVNGCDFSAETADEVLKHLKEHRDDEIFFVQCPVANCPNAYHNYNGYINHIYTVHRNNNNQIMVENENENEDEDEDEIMATSTEEEIGSILSSDNDSLSSIGSDNEQMTDFDILNQEREALEDPEDQIQVHSAHFYHCVKEEKLLEEESMKRILCGTQELMELVAEQIKIKLLNAAQGTNINAMELENLIEENNILRNLNLFEGLHSTYFREKFLRENYDFIVKFFFLKKKFKKNKKTN